jgi:hypothetical protein
VLLTDWARAAPKGVDGCFSGAAGALALPCLEPSACARYPSVADTSSSRRLLISGAEAVLAPAIASCCASPGLEMLAELMRLGEAMVLLGRALPLTVAPLFPSTAEVSMFAVTLPNTAVGPALEAAPLWALLLPMPCPSKDDDSDVTTGGSASREGARAGSGVGDWELKSRDP